MPQMADYNVMWERRTYELSIKPSTFPKLKHREIRELLPSLFIPLPYISRLTHQCTKRVALK